MLSKFSKVFPNGLSGMPLDGDINFCIYLETGSWPISIPTYHMASAELRELNAQIKDLIDKGFNHPSASYGFLKLFFVRQKMVT